MSIKKHDFLKNNLTFSDYFMLQHLCKFYLCCVTKFPKMQCKFHKSWVNPRIPKSQMLEALNVNKVVNQSEKAVSGGFRHRNRAVFCFAPETGACKNLMPDGMTYGNGF